MLVPRVNNNKKIKLKDLSLIGKYPLLQFRHRTELYSN